MKKYIACLLACLLVLCAFAEDRPDGTVTVKYAVSLETGLLKGWQSIRYIESEGLLLSACKDDAELTIALEADESVKNRLESVKRYGSILSSSGNDQRFSYSYCSKRGNTVYYNETAVRDFAGMKLVVTLSAESQPDAELFDRHAASVELMETETSGEYLAQMTGCTVNNGRVYISLDFVSIDYDSNFSTVIFINEDITAYSYETDAEALIYIPDVTSALYSIKNTVPDADEISALIREYKGIYGNDGLYLVQFDANNRIIRLQHYNAL